MIAVAAFAWASRGSAAAEMGKFSAEFFGTFDTIVTFTAFAEDEDEFERFKNAVEGEMNRLSALFDIYNGYDGTANVKTINDMAGISPVKVHPDILELLSLARRAHLETGGAVNIALGPVLAIWHDYREKAASGDPGAPSEAELRKASAHTSIDDVAIDAENGTVFLRYPDMRLDVGAIAKGYAVQRAVERVREAGLRSGIINAGGNVAIIGGPLDGRETWNIGVQAPEPGKEALLLDVLYLSGGSAVTSGNYQRYYTSGGKTYHHIIDPKTLYPAENTRSVTIIHPDSAMADVLSTAAFILPMDEARKLIAKHGAEAIWMAEDGERTVTPGYVGFSKLAQSPDMSGMRVIGQ
jgi:thiamine biosynthesis lipoprotein